MGAKYKTADDTVAAISGVAVTPSDVTVLPVTRSLYVGTAGNLVVTMTDGVDVTFTNVANGIFPVQVTKVKATGTTATGIVALY